MIPIVDAHLDLAFLAQQGLDLRAPSPDRDRHGVTLPALRTAGVRLVFATLFTEWVDAKPGGTRAAWEYAGPDDAAGATRAALDQLAHYEALASLGELSVQRSARELRGIMNGAGPLGAVILMEGADPVHGEHDLRWWFDRGVRAIGLSWAMGSRYAGGNARPGPLTSEGHSLLVEMERLGVILDTSHLADEAFDQALEVFPGAVMASHSNARALLEPSQRHLRDDQARRIAERGGVIGLNLFGRFLASGRKATMDDARRHLEHWRDLVGIAHIGIGSDLDGGFTPLDCAEGLGRPEEIGNLFEALDRAGWSEMEIRSVASGSWIDFLTRALPR